MPLKYVWLDSSSQGEYSGRSLKQNCRLGTSPPALHLSLNKNYPFIGIFFSWYCSSPLNWNNFAIISSVIFFIWSRQFSLKELFVDTYSKHRSSAIFKLIRVHRAGEMPNFICFEKMDLINFWSHRRSSLSKQSNARLIIYA